MEEATNSTTKHSKAKAVKHLVLDTGAIIANVNLHEIADFYYSPPDVIAELRSQKAMKTYETLPFEIILKEPSAQAMQAGRNYVTSLSIADMKVIALTYDLHKELVDSQDVQHSDANMTFILTQRMNSLSTTDYDSNSSVSPEHEDMNVGNDDSTKTTSSKLPDGFCENMSSVYYCHQCHDQVSLRNTVSPVRITSGCVFTTVCILFCMFKDMICSACGGDFLEQMDQTELGPGNTNQNLLRSDSPLGSVNEAELQNPISQLLNVIAQQNPHFQLRIEFGGPDGIHGTLGDYAWGENGIDRIVTQLLNQMDGAVGANIRAGLNKDQLARLPVTEASSSSNMVDLDDLD
uniref:PIN_6 domain-containing protein n=1 Tax=Heterorhabditis bacteriophora TaxID=37862 RepID=A0A1I7WP55_HETBA